MKTLDLLRQILKDRYGTTLLECGPIEIEWACGRIENKFQAGLAWRMANEERRRMGKPYVCPPFGHRLFNFV